MRMLAFLLLLVLPRSAAASWPSDPTTNVPLCLATGYQQYPEAVSDGKGGAIVAWEDQRGSSRDIYVQRVDATGTPKWAVNGVLLCGATNDQYTPRLAADGAGGAIVTWTDYRSGSAVDVYAQRVDSSGTVKWASNGIAICAVVNNQWNPDILSDGSGGAILTWIDERTLAGFARIFAQRVNGSGVAQWTANGVALTNSQSCAEPHIASNGASGAIVVWSDYRNGRLDFYAQRVLSNGVIDPAWPVGGRAIAVTAADQEYGSIVPDGSGGALISWMQQGNGLVRDIHVLHVLASSAIDPAWPALGRKLVADGYDQSSPTMMPDGSGGAFVAWDNYRYSHNIFAHHVLASGALDPAWPDTGLAICFDDGDQRSPRIVPSDTAAIVVWVDQRADAGDIYARRFFRSGTVDPEWPVDGRAISTANLRQITPTLVPDGTGGVVVAWEDRRTSAGEFGDEGEIYAQGVKGNGQLGDPPVGVPGARSFDFALRFPSPIRVGAMVMHFTLPGSSSASLEVFNVAGRRVAGREVSGEGPHAIDLASAWNAVPGVYFVRLSQGPLTSVRRLVILD